MTMVHHRQSGRSVCGNVLIRGSMNADRTPRWVGRTSPVTSRYPSGLHISKGDTPSSDITYLTAVFAAASDGNIPRVIQESIIETTELRACLTIENITDQVSLFRVRSVYLPALGPGGELFI